MRATSEVTPGGPNPPAAAPGSRATIGKQSLLDWNRDCYLYTWYYNTQALFQKGGAPWKMWNDQFQKILLANQNDDGSYKVEGAGAIGSAGSAAAGADANVYRACLCTLMFEVYYRYLKVGDRDTAVSTSLLTPK